MCSLKKCFKCGIGKELTEFYAHKYTKSGYHNQCKTCLKKGVASWSQANPELVKKYARTFKKNHAEQIKEESKTYYKNNKEEINIRNNKWSQENPERVVELRQKWTKENPGYYTMTGRIRKAHIDKNCTPPWVDEPHKETIKEIYRSAKSSSEFHEEPFHVDHIEPLKGVNKNGEHVSCGLHVWWNLRSIPAKLNLQKSNRLIVDEK